MEQPTTRSTAITPDRPLETPPVAPRRPVRRTFHGVTLTDDYAWMKDDKWQQVLRNPALLDPGIRSYLEAENRYTEGVLAPTQALQKTLVAEMRGRIKEDDSGVPEPDGPFAYLWRYRQGGQHELIGRTPRDGGDAEIILDGDALAKASDYFDFGGTQHSPNHRLEAWSADLRGSEYFTIRVRSWQTGEDLPDIVEQTSGSVVWGRDSTFFFYVRPTKTTGRCRSTVIGWAPPRATMSSSTRKKTAAGSRASRKARAAASASSPPATRKPPSAG
jgi:oligopeptidase B